MAFGFREKFKEPEVQEFTQGECFFSSANLQKFSRTEKRAVKGYFLEIQTEKLYNNRTTRPKTIKNPFRASKGFQLFFKRRRNLP